jgi:hypothetical protein
MKTNQQKLFELFNPKALEPEPETEDEFWLHFPEFLLSKSPEEEITTDSMMLWENEMLDQLKTKYLRENP